MNKLMLASWLFTQSWSWTQAPEPNVVGYRIYFSDLATKWCQTSRVEVGLDCVDGRCQGDVAEPAWPLAFFLVTAIDAEGDESNTEHGAILTVCP